MPLRRTQISFWYLGAHIEYGYKYPTPRFEYPLRHNDEDIPGQQQAPTQLETPSTGRKRAKWVDRLIQDAQDHVETPSTMFTQSKQPQRYTGYMALITELVYTEPSSWKEATSQQVWQDSMVEEFSSILKNNVWEIVPQPKSKSIIGPCWMNKVKHGAYGSVENYKVKFVAKGFSQIKGIDYDETFALVARYSSIKTILALAAIVFKINGFISPGHQTG